MDFHDIVQHIVVLPSLHVQIAHHHYNISTRCLITDSRELNVKIVLFGIRGLFGWHCMMKIFFTLLRKWAVVHLYDMGFQDIKHNANVHSFILSYQSKEIQYCLQAKCIFRSPAIELYSRPICRFYTAWIAAQISRILHYRSSAHGYLENYVHSNNQVVQVPHLKKNHKTLKNLKRSVPKRKTNL